MTAARSLYLGGTCAIDGCPIALGVDHPSATKLTSLIMEVDHSFAREVDQG